VIIKPSSSTSITAPHAYTLQPHAPSLTVFCVLACSLQDTAMMLPSLLLVLVTVGSAAAQSAASLYDPEDTGTVQSNWRDRPGSPFSLNCGHEGMAACSDVCISTGAAQFAPLSFQQAARQQAVLQEVM
jgi:hypothetical protein